MPDAKKKCALCQRDLSDVADLGDVGECGDDASEAPSHDWCIVIHRENADLVLTRREFRRDEP